MKKKMGLTLIELLAVIAIIAILFILLIPQVDNAIHKARVSGVQTDFRSYQSAAYIYFTEHLGEKKEVEKFNTYLDNKLRFTNDESAELTPWNNPYKIEVVEDGFKIIAKSSKKISFSNSLIYADDFLQYELFLLDKNGDFVSEMKGFDNVNSDGNNSGAGEELTQNPNDLDNDGWDDNTYLPLNKTPNADKDDYDYIDGSTLGTIIITAYSGDVSDLIIPPFIDGKRVVGIANDAFGYFPNYSPGKNTGAMLTSVVIPNGVVSIGDGAFRANALKTVILPPMMDYIGDSSFRYNKISSIIIPKGINVIESGAFHTNSLEEVIFLDKIREIKGSAFMSNKLTSIDLHDTLTSIGAGAFSDNSLVSIEIPDSVTSLGWSVFAFNDLVYLKLPKDITEIPTYGFRDNELATVYIPESVTTISELAFGNNKLSSLKIPANVRSIHSLAFSNNTDLMTITNCSNVTATNWYSGSVSINKNGC